MCGREAFLGGGHFAAKFWITFFDLLFLDAFWRFPGSGTPLDRFSAKNYIFWTRNQLQRPSEARFWTTFRRPPHGSLGNSNVFILVF